MLSVAAVVWLTGASAEAAEGLAWQWGESPRTWLVTVDATLPQVMRLQDDGNHEVRLAGFQTRVLTTCVPITVRKKAVDLRCALDDVEVVARPAAADAGRAQPVLTALDAMLAGAWMQVTLGFDGTLKSTDLGGLTLTDSSERARANAENLRLILARSFAALDLALPKAGVAEASDPWIHTGSSVYKFPSVAGTVGRVDLRVAVARQTGPLVTLSVQGDGIAGPGDVGGASGSAILYQYDLKVSGWANFDTARGVLVGRQYDVTGVSTASSLDALGGAGYTQHATLTLLEAGAERPVFGPSVEAAAP